MEYGFLSRAGRFLQEQKKHRRWMMIFLCLAGGVTLGTLGFLKLYGQAMTHKVKVLDCQYEVHVHTEDCWEEDEEGNEFLICEHADEAEYVIHVHNDDCYDSKGELVCPLEEHELHEHDEDCWEEEEVLICDLEETEGSAAEEPADIITEEPAQDAETPEQTADDGSQDQAQEPVCGKEVHKHDDSCYAGGTGCEKEAHTHGEGCYQVTEVLDCGTEEHSHDDSCYTIVEGDLVCGLEEHSHDDGCYDEEGNEVCGLEEHTHDGDCHESVEEQTCGQEAHKHEDSCFRTEEELTCTTEEHEHDDSCAAQSELICGLEEHEHDDSCYPEAAVTAALEEAEVSEEAAAEETEVQEEETEAAEEGHTHTDECYETELVLTCGELELHTHETDPDSEDCCYDEDCYDEDGEFIEGSRPSCGLLQLEEHVHTEECFQIVEMTPEEIAAINGGATLHVHTEECYDEEGNLICGHEVTHLHQLDCYDEDGNLICGFGGEEHQHDANCYDEEGNRICNYENAKDHEHDGSCYDEEGNLTCGYQGVKEHEHTKACYDEEGNLTCGYEGVKDHEHDADCYDIFGDLICGYEDAADHVHTEACYDEEGNLICGREVLETYEQSRRFESDNYIVVTRYNDDAEIPEEAELLVEQITPESDGEHYANRETEYRETVGDENASMKALLKIGFYVEGEEGQVEVEPKTAVAVAVQFLDEEGLAEGRPIRIVHFAEDGTETLDGSEARDNSTTFTIDRFSEFAFGELDMEEDQPLQLNYTFPYTAEPFQITFHIEGTPKNQNGEAIMIAEPAEPVQSSDTELQPGNTAEDDRGEADADTEEIKSPENDDENTGSEKGDFVDNKEEIIPKEDGDETELPSQELNDGEAIKEGNIPEIENLQFHVEALDANSEIHNLIAEYLGEPDGATELRIIQALSYDMTYDDVKLDLSDCTITAEIAPETTLFDEADQIADSKETEMGISVTAYEISDNAEISKLGDAYLSEESSSEIIQFAMRSNTMAITRDIDPNPEFTVQYYANIQTWAAGEEYKDVSAELPSTDAAPGDRMAIKLLNTDNGGNNTDGNLPKNGENAELKYMYVEKTDEEFTASFPVYQPIYERSLTKLYEQDSFQFEKFCYLENFNKFAKEGLNYDLYEIWVLKDGMDPASEEREDWDIITKEGEEDLGKIIGITNNLITAEEDDKTIGIKSGTVIRLVGNSNTGGFNDDAIFYDYDISDGVAYLDEALTSVAPNRDPDQTLYMNVKGQGINSDANYVKGNLDSGVKFAFGNNNTGGTGSHGHQLDGYNINQADSRNFGKCSFGLVKNRLGEDGYPEFKVAAPDLYGDESETIGKTLGPQFSLDFKRDGDTYTLTSVNGSGISNLDKFQYAGVGWKSTNPMWTNQFWPMDDSLETYGTEGHDIKFGDSNYFGKRKSVGEEKTADLVSSDDKKDHNSYFGMQFAVDFELTEDYCGPLNYCFFGDDDMWVFLDGELVCDIGGVHQSAGEYVNLWDWIAKGSAGKHTLKFFYNERGATGSACWMQFTLPSINAVPYEYPTGGFKQTLTVNKSVSGAETTEEFEFTVNFYEDVTGKKLDNYYRYKIIEKVDGTEVVVRNGSITSGDSFKLQDGQSIVVDNLPKNAKYEITEDKYVGYLPEINGTITENGTVTGNIDLNGSVDYINNEVPYDLPETGGPGPIWYMIAGAFLITLGAGLMYNKKFSERRV